MDTSDPPEVKPGKYFLVPKDLWEEVIAKMDTSVRKITLILIPYEDRAVAVGGLQKRTQ
jgi:hypothetical protein